MATSTDVPIYTTTLSSAVPSVTIDLSAHQNYKNIKIVATPTVATSSANAVYRFNGDTGANYSYTQTYADGSSIVTNGPTNQTSINSGFTTTVQPVKIIYLMDYANSNTNKKTTLTRQSNASEVVQAIVGLWRSSSNAAITSVTFSLSDGGNFAIGSTFSVYGIGSAVASTKATGGAIYSDSNYMYHVFTSTGAFTPTQSLTADVLVVAGGGGGGCNMGGGGGAGGVNYFASQSLSATGYTCTVGSGGAYGSANNSPGANGTNSQFGALTAAVGGGGGGSLQNGYKNGLSGGSGGGGAGGYDLGTGGTAGSATSGQGYAGGAGASGSNGQGLPGGGGGGAGGAGGAGTGVESTSVGGTGGVGTSAYSSWGLATGIGQLVSGTYYIAGGGGGGQHSQSTAIGIGGYGGGGSTGIYSPASPATAARINTGSGGAGGSNGVNSTNGASGVVIVRYAK